MIKKLIRRPVTILMIIIGVIMFGVFSIGGMKVDLLPNMQIPYLAIVTVYPGASAQSVDTEVSKQVEDSVSTMSGIDSITTYSADNLSTVLMTFEFGTNLDEKISDLRDKLQMVSFPDLVQTPIISKIDLNATPVATLAVTSDLDSESSVTHASEFSDSFLNKLSAIDGVGSVTAKGNVRREIIVTPKQGYEMLTLPIVEALSSSNISIPLGTILENGKTVSIRSVSEATSIEDIENIPIKNPSYSSDTGEATEYVTIGSLADVATTVTFPNGTAKHNGAPCVMIEVVKAVDGNSTAVVEEIKSILPAEGTHHVFLLDDQSQLINDSISNVLSSLIIGAVLAIAIIFLFLHNVKSSLIIAITMPLSVFTALICLYICNVTLNIVSLGGLAIGIGMLVDNSIVVIESITRKRAEGEAHKDAAWKGAKSVAGSIIASTLTTVCVFFPIMFTQGLTKEVFMDLSLSVIFSLSFSLIFALTVIPTLYALQKKRKARQQLPDSASKADVPSEKIIDTASACRQTGSMNAQLLLHADYSLSPSETRALHQTTAQTSAPSAPTPPAAPIIDPPPIKKKSSIMRAMEHGYDKALRGTLKKRWLVVFLAIVLFASSIALVFVTGTEFLPRVDTGTIEINVSTESGAFSLTEKETEKVANLVKDNIDHLESISYSVGKNGLIAASDTGKITVKLSTNRGTDKVVEDIRKLTASIDTAIVNVTEMDGVVAAVTSGIDGLSISISGDNDATLKEITDRIKAKLSTYSQLSSVRDNITALSEEYTISLSQEKIDQLRDIAASIPIPVPSFDQSTFIAILQTLRVGLSGQNVSEITMSEEKINVAVAFQEGTIVDQKSLESFPIMQISLPTGGSFPVTIGMVCDITASMRSNMVLRENGRHAVTISCVNSGVDVGTASKWLSGAADEVLNDYPNYTYAASGVQAYLDDAFDGLVVALLISLFLLYAIMAAQFESLKKPLVIMFSVPFSLTGGFLALTITNTTLSVVAFIGVIMLIGVVVNNAIVMLDKIKELKEKEGLSHEEAVYRGCVTRLRPILMTTLTTVLALVPLALGIGKGSELMQPMAIVVIGGLILGTLVTLILIPSIYSLFYHVKPKIDKRKQKLQKHDDPTPTTLSEKT